MMVASRIEAGTPPEGGLHVQQGQALAEAAVMLGSLAALMAAVHAVGTWQDEALRAGLAARQAAFAATRFAPDPARAVEPGAAVLSMDVLPGGLSASAQPGGAHGHSVTLRREWRLADAGVLSAHASLRASHPDQAGDALRFTRHTAVLRDAGHSAGDAQTQQRAAGSALGWGTPARSSTAAGQAVASRMNPVDLGWARPEPEFDWLTRWTGAVPPEYLRRGGRP